MLAEPFEVKGQLTVTCFPDERLQIIGAGSYTSLNKCTRNMRTDGEMEKYKSELREGRKDRIKRRAHIAGNAVTISGMCVLDSI